MDVHDQGHCPPDSNIPEEPVQPQQAGFNASGEMTPGSRVLHIYYEGCKLDRIRVMDSDKTSVLYNIDLRTRKPQMTVHSASDNTIISKVEYHLLSSRIDMTIQSESVSLTSKGLLKLAYSYTSPAFGAKMTWKPRRKMDELDMVLLDDKALPVARFIPVNWAMKKTGKAELLSASLSNNTVMDEVVATAMAVMYYRHIQRRAAAVGVAVSV